MLEVEMLKAFSGRNHSHLVRLLATYRYRGKYCLIFPWADANLRRYWNENRILKPTHSSFMWILRQCHGLCSALMSIHEYRPSLNASTDMDKRRTGDDQREGLYGRHGDIKPENILWFTAKGADEISSLQADTGTLALADFGLTDFHDKRERTRSMTRGTTTRGTPTYAPPDQVLRQRISRAYDIWSLGCVFLELITWVVYGAEGLTKFEDNRMETSQYDEIEDDLFYTILSG